MIEITPFDFSEYLQDDETIIAYLNEIIQENDAELLISALGDIAKAKGMTDIAKKAGLSRASLYRALNKNSTPRFDTVFRVTQALGMNIRFASSSSA